MRLRGSGSNIRGNNRKLPIQLLLEQLNLCKFYFCWTYFTKCGEFTVELFKPALHAFTLLFMCLPKNSRQFINLTERKGEVSGNLTEDTKRYLILQEKKKKLEIEAEALELSVVNMKRRIETRDGAIRRLNGAYHDEKERYVRR